MRIYIEVISLLVCVLYYADSHHLSTANTTTTASRITYRIPNNTYQQRVARRTQANKPIRGQKRLPASSATQKRRQQTAGLLSSNQIQVARQRVHMNTQDIQRPESINIRQRQNSARRLHQTIQRGSHSMTPSVSNTRINRGRQRAHDSVQATRRNRQHVTRIQQVRVNDHINSDLGHQRTHLAQSNTPSIRSLKQGAVSRDLFHRQNSRQIPRASTNTANTASRRKFSAGVNIRRNRIKGRSGIIRSNSRGEFKPGVTTQIRTRTQVESSKRQAKDITLNGQAPNSRGEFKPGVTKQIRSRTLIDSSKRQVNGIALKERAPQPNTARGMWKNAPSSPASAAGSLAQLKSKPIVEPRTVVSQRHSNSRPLSDRGWIDTNLAKTKNRLDTIQLSTGQSQIGVPSLITSEMALSKEMPKRIGSHVSASKSAPASMAINKSGTISSSGSGSASAVTTPTNTGSVSAMNTGQVFQIDSGATSGGQKKMSLTLMSSQTGGSPIVIESLGNIVVSRVVLPDGRTQFVIKAGTPTPADTPIPVDTPTSVDMPTSTATPLLSTVTELSSTTSVPLTSTAAIPGEETEMPEHGVGTTEPM